MRSISVPMSPACRWRWTIFEPRSKSSAPKSDRLSSPACAKSTKRIFEPHRADVSRQCERTLDLESGDGFFQQRQGAADPLGLPHQLLRRGFPGFGLEGGKGRFELVRLLADFSRAATDSQDQILQLQ